MGPSGFVNNPRDAPGVHSDLQESQVLLRRGLNSASVDSISGSGPLHDGMHGRGRVTGVFTGRLRVCGNAVSTQSWLTCVGVIGVCLFPPARAALIQNRVCTRFRLCESRKVPHRSYFTPTYFLSSYRSAGPEVFKSSGLRACARRPRGTGFL